MRNAVGIFGLACGVVVIWTVGAYGYASTDDIAAKWNMAFLFGVIATGGLFGHMVTVHLWSINRFWSVALGVVCAGALLVNLSNSLGAIAGRASQSTAEITSKKATIKADQDEFKRLQARLDKLGSFIVTSAEAVTAAKTAADTATSRRKAECGENNEKRGRFCKDREEDEARAIDAHARAAAAKAVTDTAARIEVDMVPIRERLRVAGPVQTANVQGSALARLFRLPDTEADFAATLQQFLLASIGEALIVLSMVAFEIMGHEASPPARPEKPANDDVPQQPDPVRDPTKPKKQAEPARPKLVVANSELVVMLVPALQTVAGEDSSIVDVHKAYAARCREQGRKPLAGEEFGAALMAFCRQAGIKTKTIKGMAYLRDVKVVSNMQQTSADIG
jgi:hypothetical protein